MFYLAIQMINDYDVKCYKKNEKDKLYSFILKTDKGYIYNDLDVDRFICQQYRFTINQLRKIKQYLRLYCELVDLSTILN